MSAFGVEANDNGQTVEYVQLIGWRMVPWPHVHVTTQWEPGTLVTYLVWCTFYHPNNRTSIIVGYRPGMPMGAGPLVILRRTRFNAYAVGLRMFLIDGWHRYRATGRFLPERDRPHNLKTLWENR